MADDMWDGWEDDTKQTSPSEKSKDDTVSGSLSDHTLAPDYAGSEVDNGAVTALSDEEVARSAQEHQAAERPTYDSDRLAELQFDPSPDYL